MVSTYEPRFLSCRLRRYQCEWVPVCSLTGNSCYESGQPAFIRRATLQAEQQVQGPCCQQLGACQLAACRISIGIAGLFSQALQMLFYTLKCHCSQGVGDLIIILIKMGVRNERALVKLVVCDIYELARIV